MRTDTDAEVAEAMGVAPEELVAMTPQAMPDGVAGGGTFTYMVPDADKASWRPAWRLEVGHDGHEYGKPIKLPKEPAALARYLAKRRLDGGRLFTLQMPERIAPMGQFECFVAPDACKKRCLTKGALLDHMEACHPRESKHYEGFIQQIRASIAAENPALASIVQKIAATPDNPAMAVPEQLRAAHNETVPVVAESQQPQPFSINYTCEDCGWQPNPGTARPAVAYELHTRRHRRQE